MQGDPVCAGSAVTSQSPRARGHIALGAAFFALKHLIFRFKTSPYGKSLSTLFVLLWVCV